MLDINEVFIKTSILYPKSPYARKKETTNLFFKQTNFGIHAEQGELPLLAAPVTFFTNNFCLHFLMS